MTTTRTPLIGPDDLDAILDGTKEPGDLTKGEPITAKVPGPPIALLPALAASLDSGRVTYEKEPLKLHCKVDAWREAEDKVDRLLKKNPDREIMVFIGGKQAYKVKGTQL